MENLEIKEKIMDTIQDICMNSPIFVDKINITTKKAMITLCKLDKQGYNQKIEYECRLEEWNSDKFKDIIEKTFIIIKKEKEKTSWKKILKNLRLTK